MPRRYDATAAVTLRSRKQVETRDKRVGHGSLFERANEDRRSRSASFSFSLSLSLSR